MKSRTVVIWSVVVFTMMMFASTGFAQEVVDPASVGMDADVLAGIGEIMQEALDSKTMSGANIIVARHGKIAYFESFGKLNEEHAMTQDAIFRHASSTKPLAAVALLTLVDQGKVKLTDPLSTWWPGFSETPVAEFDDEDNMTLVPVKREITVYDVLTHTSGFFHGAYKILCAWDLVPQPICEMWTAAPIKTWRALYPDSTLDAEVQKLTEMPLMAQPGEQWVYSDMNGNIATAIVEKVTGMRADTYIQQTIFEPLKMQDSWFYVPESEHGRIATVYYGHDGNEGQKGDVYTWDSSIGLVEGESEVAHSFETEGEFVPGCCGLHSTAYDYFRFCQMLLNGGELDGVRVLSKEMAQLMVTGQTGDLKDMNGYEHGFMVSVQSHAYPAALYYGGQGAYMWNGYFGTLFLNDPKDDTVLIVLSQTWNVNVIWPYVERMAYLLNRTIVD